jgi:hypothetical protein
MDLSKFTKPELKKLITACNARIRYLDTLEKRRAESAKRRAALARLYYMEPERKQDQSLSRDERLAIQIKHFGELALDRRERHRRKAKTVK